MSKPEDAMKAELINIQNRSANPQDVITDLFHSMRAITNHTDKDFPIDIKMKKSDYACDDKGVYYNGKILPIRGRELVILRLLMVRHYNNGETETIVDKDDIKAELKKNNYGTKNLKNIMSNIRQTLNEFVPIPSEFNNTIKIDRFGHIGHCKSPDGYYFIP